MGKSFTGFGSDKEPKRSQAIPPFEEAVTPVDSGANATPLFRNKNVDNPKKRVRNDNFLGGKKLWTIIAIILVAAVIVVLAILHQWKSTPPAETTESGTTATSSSSTSETAIPTTPQDIVKNDLGKDENGKWIEGQDYTLTPDPSKDNSTGGTGSFKKLINTVEELVSWLKEMSSRALALIEYLKTQTGATLEQILNPDNWVAIQSLSEFSYPGNTGFVDGKVVDLGSRPGNVGDTFFAFVNPTNGKVGYVRGACSNPQGVTPHRGPEPTPTPTPTTTLTPKDPSQDPAAKGKAPDGSGKNTDLGPGTYVPPEAKVTPAETSRVNPTQPTTTELAPGASPTPTPAPKPTSPTTAPAATPTPVPTHDGTVPSSPWG